MKKIALLLVSVCFGIGVYAQGEIDAYRMSALDHFGTARGLAMGGAFGALGGDVTGIMINPAGLGVYKSSELVGTIGYSHLSMSSDMGVSPYSASGNNSRIPVNNVSLVYYTPIGSDGLESVNFSFSYGRLKSFNSDYDASGDGLGSSLTDFMAYKANGNWPNDLTLDRGNSPYFNGPNWLGILGWNTDLIKNLGSDQYNSILEPGQRVNTSFRTSERGYIDTYDIMLGFNFSDSFYLGAGFNYTSLFYDVDTYYTEQFTVNDPQVDVNGMFRLNNSLQSRGDGYQMKFGLIWRPIDEIRLGFAYHSPTWYVLNELFDATVVSEFNSPALGFTESTPRRASADYHFSTPSTFTFSAAGVLGTKAIISADLELKNYAGMTFSDTWGSTIDYQQDNEYIDEDFRTAMTLRLGAEYRITPQLSGRLGYSWTQNPYSADMKDGYTEVVTVGTIPNYTLEGDVNRYSLGVGYKFTPQFYIDAAVIYKSQVNDLYFFPTVFDPMGAPVFGSEPIAIRNETVQALLTFGYKF